MSESTPEGQACLLPWEQGRGVIYVDPVLYMRTVLEYIKLKGV